MKTVELCGAKTGSIEGYGVSDRNGSVTNSLTALAAALGFAALMVLAIVGVFI